MKLSETKQGTLVTITGFEDIENLESLYRMGLMVNSKIIIVINNYLGIIIEVMDSRLAIGKSLADKIIVE